MGKTSRSRASVRVKGVAQSKLITEKKQKHHGIDGARALLTKENVRTFVEALMCPFCDKGPFKSVAGHTTIAHGIDGKELRDLAGLPYNAVITSPDLHAENVRRGKRVDTGKMRAKANPRAKRVLSEAAKETNRKKLAAVHMRGVEASADLAKEAYRDRIALVEPAIRRGVRDGKRFKDIARELGVATATVGRYAKALGLGDGRKYQAHHNGDIALANAARQMALQQRRDKDILEWNESAQTWEVVVSMAQKRGVSTVAMASRLRKLGADLADGRKITKNRRTRYPHKRRDCEVELCERVHVARGKCAYHYKEWRIETGLVPPCSLPECGEPTVARRLCSTHYARATYKKRSG